MSSAGLLLLAGGGHSHALMLKRWAMDPRRRPARPVVLINRCGTALYSGMVPALIAGIDPPEAAAIDLRSLCDRAGVAFVQAEITGLDPIQRCLVLANRPPLHFGLLSLDVGAISRPSAEGMAIKPLEPALAFIASEDPNSTIPFTVVGTGAAAIEVVLALRRRWPQRPLRLQTRAKVLEPWNNGSCRRPRLTWSRPPDQPLAPDCSAPAVADPTGWPPAVYRWTVMAASAPMLCCGWRAASRSLPAVTVRSSLQHPDQPPGSGPCEPAIPLARNLEASCLDRPLHPWQPQREALQLIGDQHGRAWARRGRWQLGPNTLLWRWKRQIDRRFMAGFRSSKPMTLTGPMACRGCAAKLPAQPLQAALDKAGLSGTPEDAARIEATLLLQSVDGFPALVSDPWLNGRLTTLHACSDLWACGAGVDSAQAIVTLPMLEAAEQQELLVQTLGGVQSVLQEQSAELIGGHTLESRSDPPPCPSLGVQLSLCVNGRGTSTWVKGNCPR